MTTGSVVAALLVLSGCAGTSAATPAPQSPKPSPSASAESASTPIDGTYRTHWTRDELFEELGGSDSADAGDIADGNSGEIHVTFDAGEYVVKWVDRNEACPGTFEIVGDRVIMTATTDPSKWDCGSDGVGQLAVDAAWAIVEPTLTLSDWNLSPEPAMDWFYKALLGAKPLERVQ
jgi:hypothetical protein